MPALTVCARRPRQEFDNVLLRCVDIVCVGDIVLLLMGFVSDVGTLVRSQSKAQTLPIYGMWAWLRKALLQAATPKS